MKFEEFLKNALEEKYVGKTISPWTPYQGDAVVRFIRIIFGVDPCIEIAFEDVNKTMISMACPWGELPEIKSDLSVG